MDFHSCRATEKFSSAVRALAIGRGTIKERLPDACKEISFIKLDMMPEGELKEEVENLLKRVSQVQDGEKGSLRATIEAMEESEAIEIASLVLALDHQFNG